ncbi:MAG: TatD family hydrolase [Chloroflexi bacterium]|nr:TatD family hydrolase [Chloroflexota bacterium]
MFIDTHTHIHQHESGEIAGIVSRAVAATVGAVITAGVTVEDSRKAIAVAREHERIFAGVGVHPADLTGPLTGDEIANLDDLAGLREVVVMSEIGIDHQDRSPDRDWQEDAFRAQIEIARKHGLPIVFHVREQGDDYDAHSARDATLAILRETDAGEVGGTAHYFQGRWKHAARFLDLGFHISFAKTLTRISDLEETARKTPADRILVETDAYPQPFKKNRDKWTEPRVIPAVAERLAIIRGTTVEDIQRTTTENALKMLGTRSAKVGAVLENSSSA